MKKYLQATESGGKSVLRHHNLVMASISPKTTWIRSYIHVYENGQFCSYINIKHQSTCHNVCIVLVNKLRQSGWWLGSHDKTPYIGTRGWRFPMRKSQLPQDHVATAE